MLRHFSIVYKDGSGGESINGKGNAMMTNLI